MATEKLCMFCPHFDWEGVGYIYYSTLTGGDVTGGMSCKKGHFYEDRPDDTAAFRKIILTAQTCPDYEVDKGC